MKGAVLYIKSRSQLNFFHPNSQAATHFEHNRIARWAFSVIIPLPESDEIPLPKPGKLPLPEPAEGCVWLRQAQPPDSHPTSTRQPPDNHRTWENSEILIWGKVECGLLFCSKV
ncbi:MAG: hypothetical protein WCG34_05885 [Leptolinea sp.]